MKRVGLISLALLIALAGCTSGTTIGGGLTDPGTSIAPTASETPKKPPKKKNNDRPKPTESAKPKFEVNTIIIALRSIHTGFEYKLPGRDWTSAHNGGPPAYPDDIIIFKNLDKEGTKRGTIYHSWVNAQGNGYAEGELFDSGKLKLGQQFEWVVPNKPGEYRYKDGQVPYIDAVGPLLILPARG